MEKHQKHASLTKKKLGSFGVNEIAILGTHCDRIKNLAKEIAVKLKQNFNLAYLDASHNEGVEAADLSTFTFHSSGNSNFEVRYRMNPYNDKVLFSDFDLLLVNGNHYQAEQQILILDPKKEASIKKRLAQLKNVQFLIRLEKDHDFPKFLLDEFPEIKNLKTYTFDQIDAITDHVERIALQTIPPVQGLVLVGGKSIRMGKDKSLLEFHGKAQRTFTFELLEKHHLPTFYSTRNDQEMDENYQIKDVFLGLGPFGAICSAFQKDPNKAWLVVATDLPFVNSEVIQTLLERRNPKKIATTLKGKSKDFPEPLITIWEPKAYPKLLEYLSLGISCPRKVLINNDVEIIEIDEKFLTNVNTPQDYELAKNEVEKS